MGPEQFAWSNLMLLLLWVASHCKTWKTLSLALSASSENTHAFLQKQKNKKRTAEIDAVHICNQNLSIIHLPLAVQASIQLPKNFTCPFHLQKKTTRLMHVNPTNFTRAQWQACSSTVWLSSLTIFCELLIYISSSTHSSNSSKWNKTPLFQ
jgi:hypothetical protein